MDDGVILRDCSRDVEQVAHPDAPTSMSLSEAAYIQRRNGAYLIHWVGEVAGDRPEDDNFDAAASLVVAKRLAVEGARANGYTGAIRWTAERTWWALQMTEEEAE